MLQSFGYLVFLLLLFFLFFCFFFLFFCFFFCFCFFIISLVNSYRKSGHEINFKVNI